MLPFCPLAGDSLRIARCTKKIKRKVLKQQARKARAEQKAKCCLEPARKRVKRKPLTELHVKGNFTEDREEQCEKSVH